MSTLGNFVARLWFRIRLRLLAFLPSTRLIMAQAEEIRRLTQRMVDMRLQMDALRLDMYTVANDNERVGRHALGLARLLVMASRSPSLAQKLEKLFEYDLSKRARLPITINDILTADNAVKVSQLAETDDISTMLIPNELFIDFERDEIDGESVWFPMDDCKTLWVLHTRDWGE